jgi:NADH-quinone oxidoreductase subunit M
MNQLHLPWLELAILIPFFGGLWLARVRDPHEARKWSLVFSGFAFIAAVGAWVDIQWLHAVYNTTDADDSFSLLRLIFNISPKDDLLTIDQLSAPLLSMVALLHFLTTTATLRTKIRRFSFAASSFSEALLLATFSCKNPWGVVVFMSLATLPPYFELRSRRKSTRVYLVHMAAFVGLMVLGQTCAWAEGPAPNHSLWAIIPLLLAVFIRCGIAPFHCWMPDLFEHATFGTSLLYTAPIAGAYAAARLVLPIAPDWVLQSMGTVSLITAVYAAGMSLVQREARRFFCYLFLSHAATVLAGLESVTPLGLTGALCVWLSVGLGMGGFGLTLRALESRRGRLYLTDFQGLYEHTPNLAMCFVLTGLASVGFPGTFGFVGGELLVDGAVDAYPHVGLAVVLAGALNSIAIVKAYFILFTGTRYASSVSLMIRVRERYAVLTLAALILIGGLMPQPWVASRNEAATQLLIDRAEALGIVPAGSEPSHAKPSHPEPMRAEPSHMVAEDR